MRRYHLAGLRWVDLDTIQWIDEPAFGCEPDRGRPEHFVLRWRHAYRETFEQLMVPATRGWFTFGEGLRIERIASEWSDDVPREMAEFRERIFEPFLNAWSAGGQP